MVNICMVARGRERLTNQALVSLGNSNDFNLTILYDGKGVGASKNSAISQVKDRGDLLYLSDNDVYFKPRWLETLIAAINHRPDFKIIGGWNHPYHRPVDRHRFMLNGKLVEIREAWAVAGVSWLMKWETWDRFGPFDSNSEGVGQSEDTAFCNRVREAGFKVGSVYPPVVLHTGITNTLGEPALGAELFEREDGVIYL